MAAIYRTPQYAAAIEAQYRAVLEHWPVPSSQERIETHLGETFVISCGPEDAPPVVLLHGSQANSAAWIPDIALWATRFRLHSIDMVGEPGLSAPVQPDPATDAHARWLDEMFAAIGVTRPTLVGTSLGGWLALDYATRRRNAVRALALVCPAGIGRQKNFLLKALPLLLLGPWGAHKMREMIFGPEPETMPDAISQIGPLMNAIGEAVRPRVIAIPRLTDAQLAALAMPVLAIVGGRDALLDSRETRDRLRQHAPRAEVAFIEDGYHFLPDQAARIMSFLERTA